MGVASECRASSLLKMLRRSDMETNPHQASECSPDPSTLHWIHLDLHSTSRLRWTNISTQSLTRFRLSILYWSTCTAPTQAPQQHLATSRGARFLQVGLQPCNRCWTDSLPVGISRCSAASVPSELVSQSLQSSSMEQCGGKSGYAQAIAADRVSKQLARKVNILSSDC